MALSNCVGTNIKLTVFGQSHAPGIGCVLEGLPAGVAFDWDRVNAFMKRRAPGQNAASTARKEADIPEIIAGLNERGETCGAPLVALIRNGDHHSADYDTLRANPRPGHADYTAYIKFAGHNDIRGGGQFSGRLTAPLCFAGAVCMQLLEKKGIDVAAHVYAIGGVQDAPIDPMHVNMAALHTAASQVIPAVSEACASDMMNIIAQAKQAGDSVGGIVECFATGMPAGYGDPMFDGVENQLARAAFAIPAVRGVEFGAGFAAAAMRGSQHNDSFRMENGAVVTQGDHHAGILGGITSGMPIVMRVAFKPTPSIGMEQNTVNLPMHENTTLSVPGRHDPCVVQRAVPVVEAVMAFTLCDMLLGRGPASWT